MKALVYLGPEKVEYMDHEDPVVADDHVLVKVMASGICGSDMHGFLGHDERRPAPLILGHEAAGTIEGGEHDGERVTLNPLIACGRCASCKRDEIHLCVNRILLSMKPRHGTFAQFVAVPYANTVQIPEHVSFQKAALTEPLACGWHAVKLGEKALLTPLADASCLVIGGGAIGLGIALVLKAKGATNIIVAEPNEKRRSVLAGMDGFRVFDPADEKPESIDLVFDAVGYVGTRAEACRAVRPGGVIVHIGLGQSEGGIDVRRLTLQEISFIGTYCYTPQDFRDTAQAIFDGVLGPLDWIDIRPLETGQQAFDDIRSGNASAPKIVLEPWSEA